MAQQGLFASAQRLSLALVAAAALVGVAPAGVNAATVIVPNAATVTVVPAASGCFTAGYVNLHFRPVDIGRASMDIRYCVSSNWLSRTVTTVYNTTALGGYWYSIYFINGNVNNFCNKSSSGYTVLYQHNEGSRGRWVGSNSSASETWNASRSMSFTRSTWVVVWVHWGDTHGCVPFQPFIMA